MNIYLNLGIDKIEFLLEIYGIKEEIGIIR